MSKPILLIIHSLPKV